VVAKLLGKHGDRDAVAVLELELGGGLSEPCHYKPSVVQVAYNHDSEVVIDAENVGDRAGHDELVWDLPLGADDH